MNSVAAATAAAGKKPVKGRGARRFSPLQQGYPFLMETRIGSLSRLYTMEYQRRLDEARVRQIAGDFDWRLFEPLEVFVRDNGQEVLFSGHHRYAACRELAIEDAPITYYYGLTRADEIQMMRRTLGYKTLKRDWPTGEQFWWDVENQNPDAVAIMATLRARNMTVMKSGRTAVWRNDSPIRLACPIQLREIHADYDNLGETLDVVTQLFSASEKRASALDGYILKGVALFLHRMRVHLPDVPLREIIISLHQRYPSIVDLRAKASNAPLSERAKNHVRVCFALTDAYNNKRQKTLPLNEKE